MFAANKNQKFSDELPFSRQYSRGLIQLPILFEFVQSFHITSARGFPATHGSMESYLGSNLFLPNLLHPNN